MLLLLLINLSGFAIGGMGRRDNPFQIPFDIIPRRNLVLGLSYQPEFLYIFDDRYSRSASDLGGLYPYLRFPFFLNLDFVARFNRYLDQNFDLLAQEEGLSRHLVGRGGVNRIDLGVEFSSSSIVLGFLHDIIFGSSEEIWTFQVGEVATADTLYYEFGGGGNRFQAGWLGTHLGIIGWGGWEEIRSETTLARPWLLGGGLRCRLTSWTTLMLLGSYEHWEGYENRPNLQLSLTSGPFSMGGFYRSWYYDGIRELGVIASFKLPIKRVGMVETSLFASITYDHGVKEVAFRPRLRIQVDEILKKRRRWY